MKSTEPNDVAGLYKLSTGQDITSMVQFSSPLEEYHAAFADGSSLFLIYYTFQGGDMRKRVLTRGQFWDIANTAAAYLTDQGLKKGDRIVHAFSTNSLYDLVFRLAAVLTGCVPFSQRSYPLFASSIHG